MENIWICGEDFDKNLVIYHVRNFDKFYKNKDWRVEILKS